MIEYNNVFALLDENDIVQDIILSEAQELADDIARKTYVSGKAIQVNKYNVKRGDFYKYYKFYRPIEPNNYEFGYEVDSITPIEIELENANRIIEAQKEQINYLENLLKDNGIDV